MPAEAGSLRLEGRVALLTGASRGIGLATAQRFAAEGARVVITARRQESLESALAVLPPRSAIAFAGHAADDAHRAEVLDAVAAQWGRIDVLVNAVGTNPFYGPLVDLPEASADRVVRTNVLTTLQWVQAACRHPELRMAERGGAIVNLSSVTGQIPSEGIGFYGVSKAAIDQLTRTLAVELAPRVRVNAVAPAVIRTEFARALYESREEEVSAEYPLGRLGEPEDVAAVIAFLASDDAAWVTGQIINVDGGLLTAGGSA